MRYRTFFLLSFIIIFNTSFLRCQGDETQYRNIYKDQIAWSIQDLKYHLANRKIGTHNLEVLREFDPEQEAYVYKSKVLNEHWVSYYMPRLGIEEFYLTKKNLYLKIVIEAKEYRPEVSKTYEMTYTHVWVIIKDYRRGYFVEEKKSLKTKQGIDEKTRKKILRKKIIFDHKVLKRKFEEKYPKVELSSDWLIDFGLTCMNYDLKLENKMSVSIWGRHVTETDRRMTYYAEFLFDGGSDSENRVIIF
jgi:hypothetical protein